MCGVVGILAKSPVNQMVFDALTILQHRGQDAAGMVTCDNKHFSLRKSNGLVRDVFHTKHMRRLKGTIGIGHVRYPTAGCDSSAEAQPFYVNSPYGISLAHNGNLTNAEKLAEELYQTDRRHLNTTSDSEVLLNVFAHELQTLANEALSPEIIFKAVAGVHRRCRGSYAVVAIVAGLGLVAFRDPHGIRPLIFGHRHVEHGQSKEYMIASESVALSCLGFQVERDVAPGEVLVITNSGELHRKQCATHPTLHPCLFEYVYLARPDSIMDRISVYKMRLRLGDKLADQIRRHYPNHDIDVVIPIPDTSRTAAYALASNLGLKYREGFVKNRYIGRTFIMPDQAERSRSVRRKLNAIDLEFSGKNVLLVDDSIVRGTTAKEIVEMARAAGAQKIYFASAAPMVAYPNVYGIDIPAVEELAAHRGSEAEIAKFIGADEVLFQTLDDLIDAAREGNPAVSRFEDSVFSGQYLTGDIDQAYLNKLATRRENTVLRKKQLRGLEESGSQEEEVLDLYNQS